MWLAVCRFRDADGVTRRAQRVGPANAYDKRGKLAEDALIEALTERRPPSDAGPDAIGPDALVMTLVDQHLARLAEDGRSPATLATYKFAADKLRMFLGGVRRDPNNFNKQWRQVREGVGAAGVTMHSFRKTVATLIDGGGLSARIGADHLGHTNVSMTQDKYMARGRSHTAVADLLDRTINDE